MNNDEARRTPKEQLKCPNKFVYEKGILWECKNSCRVELLGHTTAQLLNELYNDNIHLHEVIQETDKLLINQFKENTRIKDTIKQAIHNERTELGKSVLRQLLEAIE